MKKRPSNRRYSPADFVAACGVLAVLGSPALAGPEGPTVARGNATIAKSGTLTTITASNNAIINYRSFDIAKHEAVRFIQPTAQSRVLNRINSPTPTRIDGSLSSNGIVYLVNPSGVLFGNGARIDVGGISAAAANLSDADFVRGVDRFTGISGPVINAGTINASDSVRLIGNYVVNSGTISAGNAVLMAVGDDVLVSENPLSGTFVRVSAKPPVTGPVKAGGSGKKPSLAAGDLYSLAISQDGTVRSKSVRLESARAGKVRVRGSIDATTASGKGGSVEVLGSKVELRGASINASGPGGGGTVLVGGDMQGSGTARHAEVTLADASTTIRADATSAGDGGKVILWSDQATSSRAAISARGGPEGGDGGFAEISSKGALDFTIGPADLRAARGRSGTLLLDPTFVLVIDGVAGAGDQDANLVSGLGTLAASEPDTGSNTISWGQVAALTGTTANIVIQASSNITFGNITGATPGVTSVDGTATIARSGGQTLRFEGQGGTITFSDPTDRILINGAGSLELVAGGAMTLGRLDAPTGTINVNAGGSVSIGAVNAGTVVLSAGAAIPGSTVTQSGAMTASNLLLLGAADFQLGGINNSFTTVAGSLTGATAQVAIQDADGLSIGSVNAVNGLDVGSAATNRLLLQTNGAVNQTQPVVAGQLRALGTGSLQFTNASNDFGTVAGILSGPSSSVSLRDSDGFVIGTVVGTNGLGLGVAPGNVLTLESAGPVTQTSAFVTNGLRLLGTGTFDFGSINNEAKSMAVLLTGGSSTLSVRDDNGFDIGTVGGTSGLNIGLGASNVLSIQSGGGVTQSQPITAGQMRVLGTGIFQLLSVNNNVNVLAANLVSINSVFDFRDDSGFVIGSVAGTNGISVALDITNRLSLQSNGMVSQTQPINAGAVRFLGDGSFNLPNVANQIKVLAANLSDNITPGSSVTLTNTGELNFGLVADTVQFQIGTSAGNVLRLTNNANVVQDLPLIAGSVEFIVGGSVTLSNAGNNIGTLAGVLSVPTSAMTLRDDTGFTIGTVGGTSGLSIGTLAANRLLLQSSGVLSQTQPITAGELRVLGTGSALFGSAANSFGTVAANLTGPASALSLRDTDGFVIGTVSGTSGVTLGSAAANVLTLQSDGPVTQTSALATGGLRLLGAGTFDFGTLNNAAVTLGAQLTGPASTLSLRDDTGLDIGTVGGTSGVDIGAGASNVLSIQSSAGLTQSQVITAGQLRLLGSGAFQLFALNNNVGSLAANLTGTGAILDFRDDNGFQIGSVLGTNGITIPVDVTNRLSLRSDAAVSQSQPLNVGAVRVLGAGSFELDHASNDVSVLAAALTGPTSFVTLRDTTGLAIGLVSTTSGINIGAGAANRVRLISDATISQFLPIVAGGLELTGAGSFTLQNAGNDIGTLAALLTGPGSTLALTDLSGFDIGVGPTVSGVQIPTGAGNTLTLIAAGAVTQSSPITGGPLVLGGTGSFALGTQNNAVRSITANLTGAGSVLSLRDDADILVEQVAGINGIIAPTGAANTVTLRSNGAITQNQPIVAGGLNLLGNGSATLTHAGNSVGTLAGAMGGATSAIAYAQTPNFNVGTVAGTSGINVGVGGANTLALTSGGAMTQSSPIVAGPLSLSGAGSATFNLAGNDFSALTPSLGGSASLTSNPSGGLVTLNAGSVGGGLTLLSQADLRVAGLISSPPSLVLRSGVDGSGSFTFGAGAGMRAQTISLRAGDGPGGGATGAIDARTNGPTFANAAGSAAPTSLSIRADAAISSAQLPALAQFAGGSIAAMPYTILSDQGAVTIADASVLNTSVLNIDGVSVNVSDNVSVRTFTTASPVTLSGNTELAATTGNLTLGSTLATGASSATLTGDEIDLAGNVSGTGSLLIRPFTNTIGVALIGSEVGGRLDITGAELARLQPGFSALTIGNSTGTGTLQVLAAANFRSPVTLRGLGGIQLNADVRSQGTRLTFANNLRLGADVQTVTTDSAATGADVEFLGTIDALASGSQGLTVQAGTLGDAKLGGVAIDRAIGALAPLKSLSVTGASLTLPLVTSTGAQTYSGSADVRGDLTSSTSSILFTSAVSTTGTRRFSAGTSYAHQNTLTAAGPLTVITGADATFTGPTAVTGSLTVTSTGNLLATGHTSATGPMTLSAAGISLASAAAGNGLGVVSSGATAISGPATSTSFINVNAGGAATYAGLTAGTDLVSVSALGTTSSGPISAGGLINIRGTSIQTPSTIGAGTSLDLTSTSGLISVAQAITAGGAVDISAATSSSLAQVTAGPGFTLVAGGGATHSGALSSTGPIQITAASLSATSVTGQSSLVASTSGNLSFSGIGSALGAASLTSTSGAISLAQFTAGPSLTMTSAGATTLGGAMLVTGPLAINAGSLSGLSTITASSVGVTSAGPISVSGLLSAPTGPVTLSAGGAANLGSVTTNGAFTLGATGAATFTGPVSAGTGLGITSAGLFSPAAMSAGTALTLNSSAAIFVGGTSTAGTTASLTATGPITTGNINAGSTLGALAGGVLTFGGPVTATGAITASGQGLIAGSSITSGSSIALTSGAGLSVAGATSAAGALSVDAGQSASLGPLGGSSIVVSSAGDTSLLGVVVSGSTLLVVAGDSLNIAASAKAPTSITLRAGPDGTGDLAFTAPGVAIDSPQIVLRAGDGPGGVTTATVNALTNSPQFRGFSGAGTSPVAYTHHQDASIVDAITAAGAQFAGGLAGLNYTLISDDGSISITDASKFNGVHLSIRSAGGFNAVPLMLQSLTLQGPLSPGSRTIDVGPATLTLSDPQNFGSSDITIYADEINLPSTLTGTGRLTLGPGTTARPVLLGGASDSGPGTLDLTGAELDNIVDGFGQFTIGRADASGTLGFAAARQFLDPITLLIGPGGVMTLDQPLSTAGASPMRFESVLPIRMGTTLTTPGQSITIAAPLTLLGQNRITTGGGAIGITGAIDGVAAGVGSLTLEPGAALATLGAPLGQTTAPAALLVSGNLSARGARVTESIVVGDLIMTADSVYQGNSLTFAGITSPGTAFALRFTPTGASPVLNLNGNIGAAGADPASLAVDAGGVTNLRADLRSAGPVTFNNSFTFINGVELSLASAPLTFSAPVSGTGELTIDAGAGATSFQQITTTQPASPSLTLLSSGVTTFNAPASLASGIVAAGPVRIASTLTIASNITPSTFNNSVELDGAAISSVGDLTFGFSPVHTLAITSDSTAASTGGSIRVKALTQGPGALVFSAPAGGIALEQPVGGLTPLASVNFSGQSLLLPAITSAGAQQYTGATTLSGNLLTSSGQISLVGPITLAGDITIDATSLARSAGASILLDGTIDSDSAAARGLSVVAGSGAANLTGGVGQAAPLSGLTVVASSYDLPAVRTAGPQNHVGTKTLHGDLTTVGAGSITLGDQSTLAADIAIATAGGAADSVRIAGTLDDSAAGVHQLSINSGLAQTLVDAPVGSITPIRNLAVVAGSFGIHSLTQTASFRTASPIVFFDVQTSTGGDLTYDGPAIAALDITFNALNITFNNTLDGDSGPVTHNLTFNSPGQTTFNAEVGTIRFLESITTAGTGTTRIATSRVITAGDQTYQNPVIIGADTHLAATDLHFFHTLDSDATPRNVNLDTGVAGSVYLDGSVGNLSPLASLRIGSAIFANPDRFTAAGNPIDNSDLIRIGGNIASVGPVVLGGPVRLAADAVIRSFQGDVYFRSSIDSDSTPRSLSVLTNIDTSSTQAQVPLIKFNGPIGAGQALKNLWMNYLPADLNAGTLIDGRAQVPSVSTVVLADQLDPDGNIPADADTSHIFQVTTQNDLVFGRNEKLLIIGTANLRSTQGRIAVGDITAMGDVNLDAAGPIELRRRDAASVLDIAGVSIPDLGADYVSAGKINFSKPPTPTDVGPDPTFANPTGARGENSAGYSFRIFTGGIDMSRLVSTSSGAAMALDLRSLGPSDTNVAQAIAGAIPTTDTGSVTTSVSIGAGLRDQLAEIGIFVKDLLPEDVFQMLAGRSLYNDVPRSGVKSLTAGGNPFADPTLGEYRVSVNRLPTSSVIDVLSAYQALAYKITKDSAGKTVREDLRPQLRDTLLEAWRAFALAESGGRRVRLDARKFRCYLESRGQARTDVELEALIALEQIKVVLARLRAMGLSPVEYQISRNAILSGVAPEQIGTASLGDAAEFDCERAAPASPSPGSPSEDAPPAADTAAVGPGGADGTDASPLEAKTAR